MIIHYRGPSVLTTMTILTILETMIKLKSDLRWVSQANLKLTIKHRTVWHRHWHRHIIIDWCQLWAKERKRNDQLNNVGLLDCHGIVHNKAETQVCGTAEAKTRANYSRNCNCSPQWSYVVRLVQYLKISQLCLLRVWDKSATIYFDFYLFITFKLLFDVFYVKYWKIVQNSSIVFLSK